MARKLLNLHVFCVKLYLLLSKQFDVNFRIKKHHEKKIIVHIFVYLVILMFKEYNIIS